MARESNDQLPPELESSLPNESDFGMNHLEWPDIKIQKQLPTDILLITANENEFAACYGEMENVQRSWHDTLGYVDFGQFIGNKNVKVTLMKCAQGPTNAVIAVKNAAEVLYPKVVLFVGLCATLNPEKAKLGDVVISAKLATYADRKIEADGTIKDRGFKANISRNMGLLILHAAEGWKPPLKDPSSFQVKDKVHYRNAVILSGPELVNNRERRQELAKYRGEALGLEMESAGLYAAASDLGIEWAVVKAVSDFADGSKSATENWQPFSSAMAASFVRNMFKRADVIKNWSRCTNIDPRIVDAEKRPRPEERSNKDEIDAKIPRKEEKSNEDKPAPNMCGRCKESQLPDDRKKWPISKIENSFYYKICQLLDFDDRSRVPLLYALDGLTRIQVDAMAKQFESKGGQGLANVALGKWEVADAKNNVEALKEILYNTMQRVDVFEVIEEWEKLPVCHRCGTTLKPHNIKVAELIL